MSGKRLVFRWLAHARPWWLTLGAHALLLPADFMLSRDMLRGISARAAPVEPGRAPPRSRTADSSAPKARVAHWGVDGSLTIASASGGFEGRCL